jgi:hypothetical protein
LTTPCFLRNSLLNIYAAELHNHRGRDSSPVGRKRHRPDPFCYVVALAALLVHLGGNMSLRGRRAAKSAGSNEPHSNGSIAFRNTFGGVLCRKRIDIARLILCAGTRRAITICKLCIAE